MTPDIFPLWLGQPGDNAPPAPRAGADDRLSPYHDTPILVVEDEALIAYMIADILEDAGFHHVAIASNARETRAEVARRRPGLILSDVNLGPGIDGVELMTSLVEGTPLPTIYITGYATPAFRDRLASEHPKAQLLRKPVDAPRLLKAIAQTLAN